MRARALWLTAAGLMIFTRVANANGAFPASVAVLLPADRPNALALATNFGLILSEDGGATWQWTCESAETAMGALYTVGAPPEDRLFSVSPVVGLAVSTDGSCTWRRPSRAPAALLATDAFPDPSDPARVMALMGTGGEHALGGSSLYVSRDGGDTFSEPPLFTAPPGAVLTGVEIARSDPRLITLTMLLDGGNPALLRSRDDGATWTTTALTPMLGASPIRLIAVDPTDPDLIVLRVLARGGDELAITRDGGRTFAKPVAIGGGNLTAFVRLASGTMLVAGTVPLSADGAVTPAGVGWRSTDGGRTFRDWTLAPQPHLLALAERGGTLYLAGTNYSDGWALATSTDEGETIQPLSTYDRVSAIKTCAANACRENCGYQADLQIWPRQVCFVAPRDGATDGKPDTDRGGCGCGIGNVSDGPGHATLSLLGALTWLAMRSRRRRARGRGPRTMAPGSSTAGCCRRSRPIAERSLRRSWRPR